MKLEGNYKFEAPRQMVWEALMDPEVLALILPGCEKIEATAENRYDAILKIRIGPIQGSYRGLVQLSDIQEPEQYHLQITGKGPSGFMKGEGEVRLEEEGQTTVMYYVAKAQVGGRIASVGQRLLESSSKALTLQTLKGLHQQIKARSHQAMPSTNGKETPSPPPEAPSQREFALEMTKNIIQDLLPLPSEKSSRWLYGGLGAIFFAFILNWWLNIIIRKTVRITLAEIKQEEQK